MSGEQRLIPTPARDAAQQTRAHTYFVGRREFETTEVYEVTATRVRRLRSSRRYGEPSLDWHGSAPARMELSHVLISRVTRQRPSGDLQARFALYVLGRLPDGGFVLDSDDLSRWLRVAGDADDSARAPRPRPWPRRLRSRFGGSPRQSADG
jgi:hypothetical protein